MSNKTVWILSDGLAGHYNQSIGISNALSTPLPHDAVIINIRLKHKLLRSLMRVIANHLPFLLGYRSFSFFYRHDTLPQSMPSVIISAGGNTLFANIALSKATGQTNTFSGTLKGYKPQNIAKVFTVTPLKNVPNNTVLDLPPANIAPPENPAETQPFYTLLIGGDGAGYEYTNEDWSHLAHAMASIAKRDNITWKVTTSRRTGQAVEEKLQTRLPNDCIAEAIWFSSNPQKVVKRFLAESRVIFCTEDSLTMVSEAIYAHKPTVTLQPLNMLPDNNDAKALDKYQHKQFIIRSPITQVHQQTFDKTRFCEHYPDIQTQIANAIIPELNSPQ
ncbi:ELM1/GtrOC1 family putative glycosyltransferase [Alkalimarinus coralli]|uniref:ELM1/GtrOC1 family putative glycosyltransferase n=1 Tax=Alkalimarinus coralli TaxID=2935863 RepID=UPI00202B04DC|nr:ELM1/GtrOC1 family putative glycosyltransferase [Alkalimarinus coralli]